MRAAGRSRTSDWVAALRALYSAGPAELDVVGDPVAVGLLPKTLAAPIRIAGASRVGAHATHRLLGVASRGLSCNVPLRTAAIDDAVRRSMREGVAELVVLGAGLDARAYRMDELAGATVFELDHPSTQAYKRERTRALRPKAREVRWCAIDFERQTIAEVLAAAGFDAARPSVWIWEGVTMYLTHEAIEASLDAIGALSAAGSRLAMTYVPPDYGPAWVKAAGLAVSVAIGERLHAEMSPAEVAARLAKRGFAVESDEAAPEWAARYWPERERRDVRVWERLVVARKG
jgi:methyltransferase (TIGR00027 family)